MRHVGGGTKKVTSTKFRKQLLVHGSKNQLMNILLFYEWKNVLRTIPLVALMQIGHVVDSPRKFTVKIKATWWIIAHLPRVLRKRKAIQSERRVRDKEILPMLSGQFFDERTAKQLYRPSYQRIIRVLNWCSLMYCRIVRLPVKELATQQKQSRKRPAARKV